MEEQRCGGVGREQEATEEIQALADKVRPALEEKSGQKFSTYKAVKYRTQVVAGTNYFIKVMTGADSYVHLKVFKDLSATVSLTDFELNKKAGDEISL